jgi:beta-galactosidase GanA
MSRNLICGTIAIVVAALLLFFGLYQPPRFKPATYGAVFSQEHAANYGLDWKETYLAMLDDLKVKNIKIATQWNRLEPQNGIYSFDDVDWQLDQARSRGANAILVIGMKTPRWPECHIPEWAKGLGKEEQQKAILALLETAVTRYRERPEIAIWQVENEPLFSFGNCPWMDKAFLKKEVALVKSLDSKNRPVLISDSGESSFWFDAAAIGDIVGITMYRRVWFHEANAYVSYPIPASWYWFKAELIGAIFKKSVICAELQAEPWCPSLLYDCEAKEQERTMDLVQFRENLDYAAKTGLDTFYLWGEEWWYWQKVKNNNPVFWEEAKKLWQ